MSKKHNSKSVLALLRTRLANGTYREGTLLPAESVLAQEFGVSRPTVSKVYDALVAEGLAYRKRGIGTVANRPVIKESPRTFGLLLPGAGESEIFAEINDRILRQTDALGINCECEGTTANNAETRCMLAVSACESYIAKKVDGIFFAPFERVKNAAEVNKNVCELVKNAGIPMVLIDRDVVPLPERSQFDLVCLDNFIGGTVMARQMIDAGCKNIYFFSNSYSAYSVDMRAKAVMLAVIEEGLDFFAESHICGDPKDLNVVRQIPVIRRQTGIVCANDATAVILMSSLAELGYRCGTDYLLSGFDNMKYSDYLSTPLTSYSQPCAEIADVSIELLLRRMKDSNSHALTILLEGKLVERASTTFARN